MCERSEKADVGRDEREGRECLEGQGMSHHDDCREVERAAHEAAESGVSGRSEARSRQGGFPVEDSIGGGGLWARLH